MSEPATNHPTPVIIAPSLLSADFLNLQREITAINNTNANWLHLDIMDGHFVPNLTLGPPIVTAIRKATTMPLDVHLMIKEPEKSLDQYIRAGADYLTMHLETFGETPDNFQSAKLAHLLTYLRQARVHPGIALNPETSIDLLLPFLDKLDLILIMSVHPGFGGQKFIPEVLTKLRTLKELIRQQNLRVRLSIDGGINEFTKEPALQAGADVLVAGSFIFKQADYQSAITALRTP